MTFVTKIKAITTSIALLAFYEAVFFRTQFFWKLALPISIVFILAFLWILGPDFFYRRQLKAKKLIVPFILFVVTTLFLFIETSSLFRQIIIFLSVFSAFIFFAIYRKIPIEENAESKKLPVQNWLTFILSLTAFLSFWLVYNFYFAYALPLWLSMLIILAISLILFYYFFWALSIYEKIVFPFSALLGLVILEVFLILAFWATDPTTRSLLMIIVFYPVLNLILARTRNQLNRSKVIEYLIVFGLLFILLVLTLNWQPVV